MLLLAFDTISRKSSVALVRDGETVDVIQNTLDYEHARYLTIFTELILQRNSVWYGDLGAVAVTTGPGSFTGIRIGITAAVTLECVYSCKLIGVNSFRIYDVSKAKNPSIVLSASRNAFLVRSAGDTIKTNREGLDSVLDKCDVIMGDCPEVLSSYEAYVPLQESPAALCGAIGYQMMIDGSAIYPVGNYIEISIKQLNS